jgi:hypothetical protein
LFGSADEIGLIWEKAWSTYRHVDAFFFWLLMTHEMLLPGRMSQWELVGIAFHST